MLSYIGAVASTISLAQLGTVESFSQIEKALGDFRTERRVPAGEWVVGNGYDHNLLVEGVHPTRQMLDAALPENPCLITHASGHMGVANTEALRRMGITAATPDPAGGKIGREEDGTPNGYLEENAFIRLAAGFVPRPTAEEALDDLRAAQEKYLSQGYVLAQDGMTGKAEYALLAAGARAGLPLDVVGYADLRNAPELAKEPPVGRFSMGGYKIFLDGSPQGRTAWMSRPYEGEADYAGYPAWTDEQVTAFLSLALGAVGAALLPEAVGERLGGLALTAMGLWYLLDALRGKTDAPAADSRSWVALAAALAVNNAGVGVAAVITGMSPFLASGCNFFVTLAALVWGRKLGRKLAGWSALALPVSGALLVALGLWQLV